MYADVFTELSNLAVRGAPARALINEAINTLG